MLATKAKLFTNAKDYEEFAFELYEVTDEGEELLQNIRQNASTVRYDLGQRVRNQLRVIPELRFFIDDSLDYIEKIDELLKQ